MTERTPTGIPGLDELLGGGLPRNRCSLICGGPGSGKTTFAVQFLYKGALEYNEPGVYVTLSESPEEIHSNLAPFGWDIAKLEKQKLFSIVDVRPYTVTEEGFITPTEKLFKYEKVPFSHIVKLIYSHVRETNAKRLALDTLNVLTVQYENPFEIRQGIVGLVQALSRLGCTSLLTLETRTIRMETHPGQYLAHGVIILYFAGREGSMTRAIQVLKMRGIKHDEHVHPMEITAKGIVVHPEEICFTLFK